MHLAIDTKAGTWLLSWTFPLGNIKSRARGRPTRYCVNAAAIWALALILASPISIYQDVVEFGIKGLVTYDKCLENWPQNYRSVYSFVILVAQLLIPNSVMLFSHYRIRRHLDVNRFTKNTESMGNCNRNSPIIKRQRYLILASSPRTLNSCFQKDFDNRGGTADQFVLERQLICAHIDVHNGLPLRLQALQPRGPAQQSNHHILGHHNNTVQHILAAVESVQRLGGFYAQQRASAERPLPYSGHLLPNCYDFGHH